MPGVDAVKVVADVTDAWMVCIKMRNDCEAVCSYSKDRVVQLTTIFQILGNFR